MPLGATNTIVRNALKARRLRCLRGFEVGLYIYIYMSMISEQKYMIWIFDDDDDEDDEDNDNHTDST